MTFSTFIVWRLKPNETFLDYITPTDAVISAHSVATSQSFYFSGNTPEEQAQMEVYSRDKLELKLRSKSAQDVCVQSIWNGKNGPDRCHIMISLHTSSSVLPSRIGWTQTSDLDQLFNMETALLFASSSFDALYAGIIDRNSVRALLDIPPRREVGVTGEIVYVRYTNLPQVEGFSIRKHGNGTVYIMNRILAKDTTERVKALERIRGITSQIF